MLEHDRENEPLDPSRRDEFAQAFEELAPAVIYFFTRQGFSPEDARDLMQDTFLKAYRGLKGFRDDAVLKTWILRIASNVWKNALRDMQAVKRSAEKTVPLEALQPPGSPLDDLASAADLWPEDAAGQSSPRDLSASVGLLAAGTRSPLDSALRDEEGRMLREALDKLPPGMRRTVQLRVDRGLKYREIAEVLQVSVDTVKTQLHQARRRLKNELDDYFALSEDQD